MNQVVGEQLGGGREVELERVGRVGGLAFARRRQRRNAASARFSFRE